MRVLSPDLMYSSYVVCPDKGNPAGLFGTSTPLIFAACDGDDKQVSFFFVFVCFVVVVASKLSFIYLSFKCVDIDSVLLTRR